MRTTLPALAAFLLAGALSAAELKLPAEVKGDPGDFVTIPAETNGKDVKWVALDTGLKVFPSSLLRDSKTAVVTAQKPGRYRLLAYTADEKGPSEPAITTVVISGVDPTPPTPPTPPAPPVPPADPLQKTLQDAYNSDSGARKAEMLTALAAVYDKAGPIVDAKDTALELLTTLRQAALALVPEGELPNLRRAIADHLKTVLPTDATAGYDKARAKAEFARVAGILKGVK